jgi:hypothetical protein
MSQFEPGSHADARAGGRGQGPINEAVMGCGLFLFILFLWVGRWGRRGRTRFLFVVGRTLAEADMVYAIFLYDE